MPDPKGLVLSNQANNTTGKHIHNYSTFDNSLSYQIANTLRFGDYTPSFDMEGVESDEISVNSLDRIDSLSLKAPFKGRIRKIKESFKVPYMAILPRNWDLIYVQPSNGDDVPKDANFIIKDWPELTKRLFLSCFRLCRSQLQTWSNDSSGADASKIETFFTALLRTLVLGEYMFSAGSLLHISGYRLATRYIYFVSPSGGRYLTYDEWFDLVCEKLFAHIDYVRVKVPVGSSYVYRDFNGLLQDNENNESFRSLLELFRENPLSRVTLVTTDFSTYPDLADDLAQYFSTSLEVFYQEPGWRTIASTGQDLGADITALNPTTLNLSRVLAYQLVCAHFYTNSSIDFVYTAELYRQYIHSLYLKSGSNASKDAWYRFTRNGHTMDYDVLSGHVLLSALFTNSYLTSYGVGTNYVNIEGFGSDIASLGGDNSAYPNNVRLALFPVWAAIFAFRKSLRYGDYFTGSRPRPLAPINTDVSVNNSAVSVIDITRNIQAQRFANAVMRSRQKIEEYVKSLFGKAPAPDFHNPFFLVRQTEHIFGDEVQNTADAQAQLAQSRTANFASNLGQHTFTFRNDDMHPCVYLQLISFDAPRLYSGSVDRQMLHIDRFDMFNPDFQYIGDQPIYGVELGYHDGSNVVPEVFSYTTRDMEYKQRFSVCSGGFVTRQLPGWILTDEDRSKVPTPNLDPDFIRSYNTEMDQFFLSLSGYSLGTYFHFVCITSNNVNAKRPMAVDPQILA